MSALMEGPGFVRLAGGGYPGEWTARLITLIGVWMAERVSAYRPSKKFHRRVIDRKSQGKSDDLTAEVFH